MTRILVTGATGFLGGRLVERLLEDKQWTVYTTGRNWEKGQMLEKQGAHFIGGNLSDPNFTKPLLEHIDVVVHCAALSSVWGKHSDFFEANTLASRHLAQAALQHRVSRFIHISTPSIYYNYKDRFNVKEDAPLPKTFVNAYASTKYQAEQEIWAVARKGLEVIILRPRAIYGRGDTAIMPRLVRAQEGKKLRVIGQGKNIADLTTVSNVIDAILLSLKAPVSALNEAYNITNGQPLVLWEAIDEVLQHLGHTLNKRKIPYLLADQLARLSENWAKWKKAKKEPKLTRYGVGLLAHSVTLNIDKARRLLHYKPKQSNDEGLKEFVHWWKQLSKGK